LILVPAKQRRLTKLALAGTLVASGLLITAPAALASWAMQDTPAIGGVDAWGLNAVSCTAPSTCMAVGVVSASTGGLLVERRTQAGWSSQIIAQPQDNSQLFGVWCTKASACTAVGESPKGSGAVPLAERWNGTAWTIQTAPAPGGVKISSLDAVVCTSAKSCLAVGDTEKGATESPLSELWNGKKWKVLATPKPSGRPVSRLTGLSCASATSCFAVGNSRDSKLVSKTLAELWNGKKWVIQKTPNPAASNNSELDAVSCPSATTCMATGVGLAERWNGKSWSLLKIGRPQGTPADLTSVLCTKAGPCYAVGQNFIRGVPFSVAELWNGSRWSVQSVPITTSFDASELAGVSCTTAANCTAVGGYHDPTTGNKALAEDFSLRWNNVSPTPFNGVVAAGLNTVSCASPSDCVAVGVFEANTSFQLFSQHWDGTSWTSQIMPKPKSTNINGISCSAAASCEAVGNQSNGVSQVPMAEHWNGLGWAIQNTPAPAEISSGFLLAVSCASKTSCVAAGDVTKSGKERTLAEVWNGKIWKITPTPNPAGKQLIELNSVSCASTKSCLATGTYAGGTFAEVWNGKSWGMTAPVPNAKGALHSALLGVSCPTATDCLAVGTSSTPKSVPLAERWNGKKWSLVTIKAPAGAAFSGLNDISCSSASACSAVGSATRKSVNGSVAYVWTGKHWVTRAVAVPPGSLSVFLGAVSCNSAGGSGGSSPRASTASACMAVGEYNDSTNAEQMLAEQYS
jgi:hypothetical protein